ncbi:TIGR02710 family CRISPR-associated CARF protein [Thermosulfurimonas sp. F29]|uniref:TIGR02710 family CRISPR-associated CARF protein n=1 Tax=Thermosulfurimonas sp. F29 TaxID=2867247 RepID=UPI001C833FE5|nr:TIGR02710 family CRISPR-associated CARF protein [Thermosulfurimonas sp. F29]MBX6423226.1 TIGR02710 family CRISPR-associated protein [Thermosulfurimonas sp. F29]
MFKKGLLISVGTGIGDSPESILNAIKLSISDRNPNFVAFLVSKDSKDNAKVVVEELKLSSRNYKFFEIPDPNDLNECVKKTEEALRWLFKKGLDSSQIIADFTSGTKPMSSAIVMVAFQKDIGRLSYIQGKREKGIVKSGTEKVVSFQPFIINSYFKFELAYKSLLQYQFKIAHSLIGDIQNFINLLSDYKSEVKYLNFIIRGYHEWDLFHHHKAAKFFEEAKKELKGVQEEKLKKLFPKEISHIKFIGNLIYKKEKHPAIIADLLANTDRRIEEGKYDDAIARLYRIVELIAQVLLFCKYNLDSSNVNFEQIKEKIIRKDLLPEWKKILEQENKIGLWKCYKLLNDLGDPIGKEIKNFQDLLYQRNNSILAHGLTPIKKEIVEELREKVENICKSQFENFEDLYRKSVFPWQRI